MIRGRILLLVAAVTGAVAVDIARYGSLTGSVVHVVTYAVVCGAAWWAARRRPGAGDRRPWQLLAAGMTSWFAGDLIELFQFYFSTVPSVGVADVLWLAGYPLMAAALVIMVRRRAPGRLRGGVLDALALSAAMTAAAWQFVITPTLELGYSVAETVVPALYPLADIVLLAALLFIVLSPGRRGAPTRLVLVAVMLFLAIDIGYNVLPFFLDYEVVQLLGPVILIGNVLLAAAGLHAGRSELTEAAAGSSRLHPARVVLLGLALLTAPTLTLVQSGFGQAGLVALAATAACCAFVLVRFTHAVRQLEAIQAQLAFQVRHDPLTGAANRAALDDHLRSFRRPGAPPVAVFYLDLDGFKTINDEYGHEAGDRVLTAAATRLGELVRAGDLVARLGGDEFVVVCTEPAPERIADLAERMLRAVGLPVPYGEVELTVGVSVGVAVGSGAGMHVTDLIREADAAMYTAKRQGRGRWVRAGQDTAPGLTPSAR